MKETGRESITLEVINPQKAHEYLATNVLNRTLKEKVVKRYASDMEKGQWIAGSSTITFDIEGHLIDGQHRLQAIILSNTDQKFFVARGVHHDAQLFGIDKGAIRTSANTFQIRDIPCANVLIGTIKLYDALCNERFEASNKRLSDSDLFAMYEKMPQHYQDVLGMARKYNSYLPDLSLRTIGALYLYLTLIKKHPEEVVRRFFDELSDKINTELEVIKICRRQMARARELKMRNDRADRMVLLCLTWNCWIKKKNVQRMPKPTEDLWFI